MKLMLRMLLKPPRNTPLLKASNLSEKLMPERTILYLKWEANNPTRTHKDRAAYNQVLNAVLRGYKVVTVGTCGNFGVSIAYYAYMFNIKAVVYIPASYSNMRLKEMLKYGAEIVYVDGEYEDTVKISRENALKNGWYDANPGSVNDMVNVDSFSVIALEIFKTLRIVPSVVTVPVGNGTTLAGIYRGFKSIHERYNVPLPVIVGATTSGGNQILESWRRGEVVYLNNLHETWVNEPLVSRESFNCREALRAVRETGGKIYAYDDNELLAMTDIISKLEYVSPLPASSSSILAALDFAREEGILGIYVAIVTGGTPSWRRH